ncbi:MAG: hypothetical protein ACYDG2_17580 [Ruminiclostridium sp.]
MGCFGGKGSCSGGFGCEWLIILVIFFLFFCNGDDGFLSNIFGSDCDTLVWIAIILLLLFVCNNREESCD